MPRSLVRSLAVLPPLVFSLAIDPSSAQESAATFTLRPGDAVRIEIKDEPTLSGSFDVSEDGSVLLPGIGLVQAGGRPFAAVRDELLATYRKQLVDPVVRISALIRVAVLGEVPRPGLYPVDPTLSLSDVLASAGGLTPIADAGKIWVIRDGKPTAARLDPRSPDLEIRLRPGDQVLVGRRSWLGQHAPFIIGALGSVAAATVASLIVR